MIVYLLLILIFYKILKKYIEGMNNFVPRFLPLAMKNKLKYKKQGKNILKKQLAFADDKNNCYRGGLDNNMGDNTVDYNNMPCNLEEKDSKNFFNMLYNVMKEVWDAGDPNVEIEESDRDMDIININDPLLNYEEDSWGEDGNPSIIASEKDNENLLQDVYGDKRTNNIDPSVIN